MHSCCTLTLRILLHQKPVSKRSESSRAQSHSDNSTTSGTFPWGSLWFVLAALRTSARSFIGRIHILYRCLYGWPFRPSNRMASWHLDWAIESAVIQISVVIYPSVSILSLPEPGKTDVADFSAIVCCKDGKGGIPNSARNESTWCFAAAYSPSDMSCIFALSSMHLTKRFSVWRYMQWFGVKVLLFLDWRYHHFRFVAIRIYVL